MPQSSRTFRIFVSSTFSDLKSERNALQEKVFPRLRDLAVAHGCRFQAIDLRWGVSEEAALDQQTMKICLSEIERCQKTSPRPNFIILLGNRYGWKPLPYEILVEELEQILSVVSSEEKTQLEQWYCRDNNAVPAVYLLQPRSGIYEDNKTWEEVEYNLHQALLTAMKKLSLPPESTLKYTASATEQEIVTGALQVSDAKEHVFCFFREIEVFSGNGSADDSVDKDLEGSHKQEHLKNHLRKKLPNNIHEYKAHWQGGEISQNHLQQFCDDVYNELSKVILEEIKQLETVDLLEREISSHEVFGKERARVFIGRTEILETIESYVENHINRPLIIWGESGTGKSALMAKAVERLQVRGQIVIYRFIGVTPESSNIRSLLEGLCRQISRKYGVDETSVPTDYKELIKEFPKRLEHATIEKPIILFLDALDQLSKTGSSHNLPWLPVDLPPNVRIIVSTLPGESLRILQNKLPEQNLHELQLMPIEDGQTILNEWFKGINRRLQENQEKYLLNKFSKCQLPLYLKLLFEEAKLWKSYDSLLDLSEDIPGILKDLFKRLTRQSNHGNLLVSHSLGYLAAAKNGLSEDELLDVLSMDVEVLADFQSRSPKSPKVNHLPVVVWSRLYLDLEPYLMERLSDGISLLGFYHRQMLEACQIAFRDASRHAEMAVYFNSQPLYLDEIEQEPNLRKLSEMVYQQTKAGFSTQAQETLLDYVYLQARLAGHGVQRLIEDFTPVNKIVVGKEEEKPLTLLQDALRLSAHVLARDPLQLPSQLTGRLLGFSDHDLCRLLDQVQKDVKHPWLRPLYPCFEPPGGALIHTLDGHSKQVYNVIVTPDGSRAVSSAADHTFKMWNLENGECLSTIGDIKGGFPRFVLTSDGRKVVFAEYNIRSERDMDSTLFGTVNNVNYKKEFPIRILDLERGKCIQTLVGHTDEINVIALTLDGKHIISGSRDHTLKVWNLENGDCLHTLEGHNNIISTIVLTPDGRWIVSGSLQTIKVWDIEGGECIFTLNGHKDWITVLAVTPNGKRLISGSGKFESNLKVWNLESGQCLNTLLGHSDYISSIQVISNGQQVVSGSHDKTLKVWNLENGECVHTLVGHTDKVTSLAIRPNRQAVSGSWDGTIKVWNLDASKCLQTLRSTTFISDFISLSPDGQRVISGSLDGAIKVWNLENDASVESQFLQAGYRWPVMEVRVTADGRRMVSDGVGEEGEGFKVMLFDIENGTSIQILKGRLNPFNIQFATKNTQFSSDGRLTITIVDHAIKVWNLEDGKCLHTLLGHTDYISKVVFTHNRDWVISGSADKTLRVWDLVSGACLQTMIGHMDEINQIVLTPDEQRVISMSKDGTLKVWNLMNGKCIKTLSGVNKFVLSPDGQYAVSIVTEHTLQKWDLETGKCIHKMKGHTNEITDFVITPEGQHAISASLDHTLKVWSLASGNCNHTLVGHTDEVLSLVVTPDARRVISGSADKTLKVWDLNSGECLITSEELKGAVTEVLLTSDGQWAVSAGDKLFEGDNTLKIRDLKNNRILTSFECNGFLRCISISIDGLTYAAGDVGGRVYYLHLENLTPKTPVVTAWRSKSNPLFWRLKTLTFGCPYCNIWSEISKSRLGSELACPNCGKNLKLNSFTIHGDY
jgi:WD40 repeat protein